MAIAQALPGYGVHFYTVAGKAGTQWKLGVSPEGIGLYDVHHPGSPRKVLSFFCYLFSYEMVPMLSMLL